ncbi:MAG: ankyrin repeat domain-containing protein [Treponema sp.]|nr:ankyrin repeat domain-containing protein [Treponema sp.]
MSLKFDMSRKTKDELVLENLVSINIDGKVYSYFMTNCWFTISERLWELDCISPLEKYFEENPHLAKAVREKMAALGATWSLTVSNGAAVLNYYDASSDKAYITYLSKLRSLDERPSVFKRFVSAVMLNDSDRLREFISMGIKADIFNEHHITPLMIAAASNSCSSIKTLLELGADINASDEKDQTPLMYSTFYDSKDAAELLLSYKNIKINARDITGSTALYRAAAHGSFEVLKILIEHGAEKDFVNCFGETALVRSIINRNSAIACFLIESGTDVNLSNGKKRTPIFACATYNCLSIAEKLIGAGASPNIIDMQGESALIEAAERDSEDVIKLFLNLHSFSEQEIEKAVIRSSLKGLCNSTSLILENSGKNQKKNSFAALISACLKDCHNLINICMDFGCDINDTLYFKMTPLMIACYAGAEKAAAQLIDCGADVNRADSEGITALMYAASKNNPALIMLLLQKGADRNALDKSGKSFDDYTKMYDSRSFSRMVMDRVNALIEKRDGENDDQIPSERKSFRDSLSWYMQKYFERFPDKKNSDIYKDAGLTKQNFSKIISSRKPDYRPKKRTVISLAVGMKLSKKETENFLQSAGYIFSKSDKTDMQVMQLLSSGNYNIFDWNNKIYETTGKIFFMSIIAEDQ